jgi:hypothetical protein
VFTEAILPERLATGVTVGVAGVVCTVGAAACGWPGSATGRWGWNNEQPAVSVAASAMAGKIFTTALNGPAIAASMARSFEWPFGCACPITVGMNSSPMKHVFSSLLAVAGALVLASCGGAKSGKPYPLDTCLVSGEKLGSMGQPVVMVHAGQEIKFCCKGCVPDFEKEPAKFLTKLAAPLAVPAVPGLPAAK